MRKWDPQGNALGEQQVMGDGVVEHEKNSRVEGEKEKDGVSGLEIVGGKATECNIKGQDGLNQRNDSLSGCSRIKEGEGQDEGESVAGKLITDTRKEGGIIAWI